MDVLFSVQGMLCFHLENNFQTEKKKKIILQKKEEIRQEDSKSSYSERTYKHDHRTFHSGHCGVTVGNVRGGKE